MNALNNASQTESSMTSVRGLQDRSTGFVGDKSPFTRNALGTGILSVTAFHEKAGRSQVGSFVFSLNKGFLPPSGH